MPKINDEILVALIKQETNLQAITEYRFCAEMVGMGKGVRERLKAARLKDWRFDLAILDKKIAIELEGGVYTGGRHTRGNGYTEDINKYNCATVNGWKVLRYTHINHKYSDVIRDLRQLTHLSA